MNDDELLQLPWRAKWTCGWCGRFINSYEAHIRPEPAKLRLIFHERCYQPMLVALRLSK